ncbi:MAG: hypothetical protein LBT23_10595 [Synergistaceae bacterium]|jgi:hypothetical protein|nr:hypothetical protein [Synergistaceae bacterium]
MALSEARKEYTGRRLGIYLEAEEIILRGQSYKIGSRMLTRADLAAVQSEIRRLENILETGGIQRRAFRFVLRDL